ncbi:SH3 domain-containing protein [Streptomyces coeruleorubidus]|uniref:SH3 domain-containing protein n=1 Tax=Streptomyces coeruleorubidus TaxID=116188 RepID=UPI003648AC15
MSLRSSLTSRLSIAAAAGILAATAAVTPAVADDDWGTGGDPSSGTPTAGNDDWNSGGNGNHDWNGGGNGNGDWNGGGGNGNGDWNGGRNDNTGGNGDHHNDPRTTRGVVTANTLALRSAPNRGSQIIRFAHKGDVVSIFCKWEGESVQGNRTWYLLTDGTWAWGSARFIDPIGRKPRRC